MSEFLQFVASGVGQGAIYGLIGVGFVIIYNVTGIINFAQGHYLMLGALTAVTLRETGLPAVPALLLAIVVAALAGLITDRAVINPARRHSTLTLIILTVGVAIAVEGLALLVWGVNPQRYPPFTAGPPLFLGGAAVSRQTLWVLGVTLAIALALWWFFQRTVVGKAMQACAMNRDAARLQAIDPAQMSLYAFTLAAAVAGVAGVVLVPITSAYYDMGVPFGLKGFTAAVLGGLVSPFGALLGGLLLGVAEALAVGYVSSAMAEGVAFAVLALVLVARPEGLLAQVRARWA